MLVDIWKQILGVKSVFVSDNFFDLGGNSLLAARLLHAIASATGVRLPLREMFTSATVRHLAHLLRDGVLPEADDLVIQIQQGNVTKKKRFFAIVEAGVNAIGYVKLGRHLDKDQPFYIVRGRGEPGDRLYTIDQHRVTAEKYIRAMREVQPHGPYCLGGVCQGAIIAFEMVRQLEAAGEVVALLVNLNTWPREHSRIWIVTRIRGMYRRWKALNPITVQDKYRIIVTALQNRFRWAIKGKDSAQIEMNKVYWPESFEVTKVNCKIVVIRTFRQFWIYRKNDALGWRERTNNEVTVRYMEGEPLEIFRAPQVVQLANHFSALQALAADDRNAN